MRRRLTLLLGLLAVIGAAGAEATAANWPRFRGPNGTGIADDKGIPVQWSEKDGILWKVPLPGGNSCPVVWGDRLFIQSAGAQGKERLLLCLDVATGRTLWSQSVPGTTFKALHALNSLASSTPATDGERVVISFWDGSHVALYAYDLNGKLLWHRDLGAFVSQHGAGTSPVIYGDLVYFANDQDGAAMLYALDVRTGKTAWQTPRKPFRACYSTPFLLEKPGEAPELIVASTAGITSYDPDNGKENWTFTRIPYRTVASPVYGQGNIFITSGEGPGGPRHATAVKVGGKGDVTATHLAWEDKKGFPYVPTMLIWGEHLYFVNNDGIAGCYVAKTGEQVWFERLNGKFFSSPVLIDGKVYAASEEGDVSVFEAAPTFKLLAKNKLGEPVMASPAVADNRLFIRGKDHLFCIGKPAANAKSAGK
jgi:outer membrane protein assembly factor BamB